MNHILYAILITIIIGCQNSHPGEKPAAITHKANKENKFQNTEAELSKDTSLGYNENWCSSEILKVTSDSLEQLDMEMLGNFLSTFHINCANNTEFSQWSNELLFAITSKYPAGVIQCLAQNKELSMELILKKFEEPIHDGIDLLEFSEKINASKGFKDIKNRIINALDIAISKYQNAE